MRVDPATTADRGRIVDLWVALASDQRRFGSHLAAESNRDEVETAVTRHLITGTLLVARDDRGIRGFVMFELESGAYEQDVTRGLVQNLYVEPGARNRGMGSALLDAAEGALAAAGADVVALEALVDNEAARRFYRDRGYEPHRIEFERPVGSDTHTRDGG